MTRGSPKGLLLYVIVCVSHISTIALFTQYYICQRLQTGKYFKTVVNQRTYQHFNNNVKTFLFFKIMAGKLP